MSECSQIHARACGRLHVSGTPPGNKGSKRQLHWQAMSCADNVDLNLDAVRVLSVFWGISGSLCDISCRCIITMFTSRGSPVQQATSGRISVDRGNLIVSYHSRVCGP